MRWYWPWPIVHVDDVALLAIAAGAEHRARVAAHVRECQTCSARLLALDRAWAGTRDAATADADRAFTDARLERQRAQILNRLSQHGQPARILAFPSPRRFAEVTHQVARRWVAAAAVIGLVAGMAAGRFIGARPESVVSARRVAPHPSGGSAVDGSGRRPSGALAEAYPSDEALLVELDAASLTPRFEPLQTLEALTPRLREAGAAEP
jgi:hypothetical protein